MARTLNSVVGGVLVVLSWCAIFGCATAAGDDSGGTPQDVDLTTCEDDCVQPPLLRDDLVAHLQEHQERILSRVDYMNDLPPPLREIIFEPVIDDVVREGPEIVDSTGEPFQGDIDWHYVEFEGVTTTGVDAPRQLRGREVSGAHCFFARKPNSRTTIFALLAVRGDGADSLWLAGPNHRVTSLDIRPVQRELTGSIRLSGEGLRCVYRHDENLIGALVIPLEYTGPPAAETTHYAVYVVSPDTETEPTGKTVRVVRSLGLWTQEITDEVEIPLREYDEPETEFLGVYDDLHRAMVEVDDELRELTEEWFRLRPEFVYSALPWQAYFSTGPEEFCPKYVECYIPSKYLNIEEFTPMSPRFMRLMSELWDAQRRDDSNSDEEDDITTEIE